MGLGIGDYVVEFLATCGADPAQPGEQADFTLSNGAEAMAHLLDQQVAYGQRNVIFFCYQYFRDEHIPVLSRYW